MIKIIPNNKANAILANVKNNNINPSVVPKENCWVLIFMPLDLLKILTDRLKINLIKAKDERMIKTIAAM